MGRARQGAVTASLNAGGKILEGKSLDAAEWQKDFEGARPLDLRPASSPDPPESPAPHPVIYCGLMWRGGRFGDRARGDPYLAR